MLATLTRGEGLLQLHGWQSWGCGLWGQLDHSLLDQWSPMHAAAGTLQFVWLGRWGYLSNLVLHVLWECFENTNGVVYFFTQLGFPRYGGDSVLNSAGDLLSFSLGFGLATFLPAQPTVLVLALTGLLAGASPFPQN